MTDGNKLLSTKQASIRVSNSLAKRHFKEKNFKFYGQMAICLALFFLCFLFYMILSNGIPGLFQHYVILQVEADRSRIDPKNDFSEASFFEGDAKKVVEESLYNALGNIDGRQERRTARSIISPGSDSRLIDYLRDHPELFGKSFMFKFAVDDDVDTYLRGYIDRDVPEEDRRLKNLAIDYVDILKSEDRITYELSDYLFFGSASRNAEMAGIKGAFIGSILTLLVCLSIAFR